MEKLRDKKYWQLILIRALKTFLQTLVSVGGLATVTTFTELASIDWQYVLIASVGAGLLSLINNIVGTIPEYEGGEEYVIPDDTSETD